ncbi:MAG: DUF11 domain-containing protein, partial [Nitrososphaerales archaeon]
LAVGQAPDITIQVMVKEDSEAGNIENNVAVTNDNDNNDANNSDSEDTDVETSADLTITKTDDPDPVTAGSGNQLTYTIQVINNGPSVATNVEVIDTLPAGVTFVSATGTGWDCNESGGVVTCTPTPDGSLPVGQADDITIIVTVDPFTPAGTITNEASVTSETSDPSEGNNSAEADTEVEVEVATITIEKNVIDPDGNDVSDSHEFFVTLNGETLPVTEDSPAIFTVNPGDYTAEETSDPDYELVGFSPDDTVTVGSGGSATITVTNKQKVATITIVKNVVAPDGTDIADPHVFSVTLNGETKTFAEGSPTVFTVPPGTFTAVETQESGYNGITYSPSDTVTVGSGGSATITVTNKQNAATITIVKNVVAPDGTDIADSKVFSVTLNGETKPFSEGSPAIFAVPPGEYTAVETPDINYELFGYSPSDTVTVGSGGSATITVTNKQKADVSIIKVDSQDPVVAGTNLIYTLTITNNGPGLASSVVVTDTLPAAVTLISVSSSQGGCIALPCDLGALASGAVATVTITVFVNPDFTGTLTNTAAVSSTTPDPNAANNSDGEETQVQSVADVSIIKTDSHDPVTAGNTLTYTLQVTNPGPSTATNAQVTETLPAGVTFVSATPSQGTCSPSGSIITCNLGDIPAKATVTITITVTVNLNATGTLLNVAAVLAAKPDPNPVDNTDDELTKVSIPVCFDPPFALVSWWPGAGSADDIIDNNPGGLKNGASFGLGKVGQAFNMLSANSHVRVNDNTNLNIVGDLTVDAWINLPEVSFGSSGSDRMIVHKGNDGLATYAFSIEGDPAP